MDRSDLCDYIEELEKYIKALEIDMSRDDDGNGILEYGENLFAYLKRLGWESPDEIRIKELEAELANARGIAQACEARAEAAIKMNKGFFERISKLEAKIDWEEVERRNRGE
jgi:hypothetical protein